MLREEAGEPNTLELLKQIILLPELKIFRLAEGTAFSLLYGHRKSTDLDFFTDQSFDKEVLLEALENNFGRIATLNERFKSFYQCTIQNIKSEFVSGKIIDQIPFADIKDLIALKLNAVEGRSVKKDFWDVAQILQHWRISYSFIMIDILMMIPLQ